MRALSPEVFQFAGVDFVQRLADPRCANHALCRLNVENSSLIISFPFHSGSRYQTSMRFNAETQRRRDKRREHKQRSAGGSA
jgi:hypothetical protein